MKKYVHPKKHLRDYVTEKYIFDGIFKMFEKLTKEVIKKEINKRSIGDNKKKIN